MQKFVSAPVTAVRLADPVLANRLETGYRSTIPATVEKCRETGRIDSFKLEWKPGMPHEPHHFWDSDFAKVLEGMCYELGRRPEDEKLAAEVDTYVDLIISAQQPDGYLNTCFTQRFPEKRWTNIFDHHELYCAGHLMEAAVAHYTATGNRKFLDCLCRYADYIATVFGPGPDQIHGYPGHEEIELALCKLAAASGNDAYLKLAKFFVDERGREPNFFVEEAKREHRYLTYDLANRQAHVPVREQRKVVGHSVRALYLYAGMADVAGATDDAELLQACERLFENLVERRMYITGGCGSTPMGEAFTVDWNLPNDTDYAESCASMALVQFARRMLNLTGRGRYADIMEQALYNGALSGISLDGTNFFYANLLEVDENTFTHGVTLKERVPYFDCSCCPTSFCRFLPQLGSFAWSSRPGELRLNIPAAGEATLEGITVEVGGSYPYAGEIPITLRSAGKFRLSLRIPGWCRHHELKLNGRPVENAPLDGYVTIEREWQVGDRLDLTLDLPVEAVRSNPHVTSNAGRIALMRGPVVYALESVDNGRVLPRLAIRTDRPFELIPAPGLPEGTVAIRGTARKDEDDSDGHLYYTGPRRSSECDFIAIPYALWQNRGPADMAVWIREA